MNFNELYKKIHAISEGETLPVAPTKDGGAGAGDSYDNDMEECMPMPIAIGGSMAPEHEQDHVSMNVSLNGSGTGGVRDLMNILRDIEQAGTNEPHGHDEPEEPLIGDMVHAMGHEQDMGEEYENSVHGHKGAHKYDVGAVLRKGNDMHSKSHGALKHNGGENPMHEALVDRLTSLYQTIKEAEGPKTMSRAAKGNEKYGKDGMKALAKAGREGKDLDKIRDKYNKYD